MFKQVPFKAEHLEVMRGQRSNFFLDNWIEQGLPEKLEKIPNTVTGMWNDVPMVCGGIGMEYWTGRAEIWTVFNEDSKKCFVPVFRGIKAWIDKLPVRRIELSIPRNLDQSSFDIACRRARRLGFHMEAARLAKYFPKGEDACLFAKIKEHTL